MDKIYFRWKTQKNYPETRMVYVQPWWLGVYKRQLSHSVDHCVCALGGSNPIEVW